MYQATDGTNSRPVVTEQPRPTTLLHYPDTKTKVIRTLALPLRTPVCVCDCLGHSLAITVGSLFSTRNDLDSLVGQEMRSAACCTHTVAPCCPRVCRFGGGLLPMLVIVVRLRANQVNRSCNSLLEFHEKHQSI
ncbi:hypothetical protein MIND_01321300 [Mycena indigotica]|uniref:Uncharacterized protein n=1 Tax=Mycena indigotica TaxID=2126181 RepID=A0A8H6S195_9AGAR|nr:uncharacterized protein MIND_01321300 [Mycena indigotica]KAF7290803.1 hypothetical protein MIND_01321300 [Mycena indigotica]